MHHPTSMRRRTLAALLLQPTSMLVSLHRVQKECRQHSSRNDPSSSASPAWPLPQAAQTPPALQSKTDSGRKEPRFPFDCKVFGRIQLVCISSLRQVLRVEQPPRMFYWTCSSRSLVAAQGTSLPSHGNVAPRPGICWIMVCRSVDSLYTTCGMQQYEIGHLDQSESRNRPKSHRPVQGIFPAVDGRYHHARRGSLVNLGSLPRRFTFARPSTSSIVDRDRSKGTASRSPLSSFPFRTRGSKGSSLFSSRSFDKCPLTSIIFHGSKARRRARSTSFHGVLQGRWETRRVETPLV